MISRPSKIEIARQLAASHYEVEPGMRDIYLLLAGKAEETDAQEPIRLLEVDEETVPTGIEPIWFSPSGDVPYPTIIVVVTPQEFEQIGSGQLKLPEGWRVGDRIERGTVTGGAEHGRS